MVVVYVGGASTDEPLATIFSSSKAFDVIKCDIKRGNIAEWHEENKRIVEDTLRKAAWRYGDVIAVGKSYGVRLILEAASKVDRGIRKVVLLSPPLWNQNKGEPYPPLSLPRDKEVLIIYGLSDPYVRQKLLPRAPNVKVVSLPGDHSLRPLTNSKVELLLKLITE
ncbi:MAG: hypothetical protein D6769_03840 [Methanobacteriota archaeon]|nr:MAG: hypothetical protein D6769_03840 [Euryarchaeota archaeon]